MFHEGQEIGDRFLHDAGALDHLGQEHLAGAKEVADDIHPVHKRAFDEMQRPFVLVPRLLDVLVDKVNDAIDERVLEPLCHRGAAPGFVLDLGLALLLDGFGKSRQAIGGVGTAIEHHVLDAFQEVLGNLIVNLKLAGIDNAHVQAGLDRVVEKDGIDGFADGVVPAVGEGDVAHAARGFGQRK